MTPTIDLRPLGAGQLFDRALRLYRKQFLTFIGIVALTRIPILIFNIILSVVAPVPTFQSFETSPFEEFFFFSFLQNQAQPSTSSGLGANLLSFITWVLTIVGSGALVRAAVDSYFGEKVTILEGFRRLNGAWWTLLGASFIGGVVSFLLGLWTIVPLIGWFTGPGMIIFYSLVVIPFLTPVIVVEEKQATSGLPRALDLAQRRFWWFIGFMLLLGLFSQIIVTGPAILLGGLVTAVFGNTLSPLLNVVFFQTINLLLNMFYLPIQLTCVLMIYLDVRVRSEGLDLAIEANAGDDMLQRTVDIVAQAPMGSIGYFPPRSDWRQYFYLSLIVIGIYALLFLCGAALLSVS